MSYKIPFPKLSNSQINKQLLSSGENSISIHSDISKLLLFDFKNKQGYLNHHLNNLFEITEGFDLWMPSFNYDFLKTLIYEVGSDIIQVGILNSFFNQQSSWRTTTPVFNFCGNGYYPLPELKPDTVINPFSHFSEFGHLYRSNSIYGFYGANLSSCTLLHFAECLSQNLLYRYPKFFKGKVILSEQEINVKLKYYVRPLNNMVIYNWGKIKFDLIHNDLYHEIKVQNFDYFSFFNVKNVVDFWVDKINSDPYYFLEDESKKNIKLKNENLGRGFELKDFE